MKEVEVWGGKKVMAFQDADLFDKAPILAAAEQIWYQEWIKSGVGSRQRHVVLHTGRDPGNGGVWPGAFCQPSAGN